MTCCGDEEKVSTTCSYFSLQDKLENVAFVLFAARNPINLLFDIFQSANVLLWANGP